MTYLPHHKIVLSLNQVFLLNRHLKRKESLRGDVVFDFVNIIHFKLFCRTGGITAILRMVLALEQGATFCTACGSIKAGTTSFTGEISFSSFFLNFLFLYCFVSSLECLVLLIP